MAIKARMTFKKNPELRKRIGKKNLDEVTREDFNEYQLFRVREQMRYAEENSPYYRNKFKDAGVRPEDINTWEDLEKIPFTEPADLAESPFYFFAVSRTKLRAEFTTTGTTGHRKTIGYTTNDMVSKVDIVASALKDIGMRDGDSLHIMFPLVMAWDPSLIMAGACKILGYGSSICSETDIQKQYETIKSSNTTFIIGLPSFIYRVTMLMTKDVDLKSLGIKKIISTSEPLSESMRKRLEEAWGCKVLDVWGMTEFGLACAVECDEQNGLHTDEANLLFEVIDPETGKHVPDGQEGELVITALNAECTTLIRYRTHDIVRKTELLGDPLQYLEVLLDLLLCILLCIMTGVRLEEVDLPHTNERTCLLGLVPEGVDQLVDLEWKVLMGSHPQREHRVHRCFACWPDDESHIQFVKACVRHPVYFGVESLDVVLLLLELGLGDQKGERDLIVSRSVQFPADVLVDERHYLPSVRGPDIHSLDRVSLVREVGLLDDVEVPFVVIVHPGQFTTP